MRRLAAAVLILLAAGVAAIPNAPSVVAAPAATGMDPQRIFSVMIAMCTIEPKGCEPKPAPRPKLKPSRDGQRSTPTPYTGDVWSALARCESGNNATSRSANGLYTGAFQFADATWQSLGYSGEAADHPYATQLEGAQRLQARSGWGQWPRCARKLGLR